MYKVTKARIIKDGRPVKMYEVNAETDDLDATRADILKRYAMDFTNEVGVDLQYKRLDK